MKALEALQQADRTGLAKAWTTKNLFYLASGLKYSNSLQTAANELPFAHSGGRELFCKCRLSIQILSIFVFSKLQISLRSIAERMQVR